MHYKPQNPLAYRTSWITLITPQTMRERRGDGSSRQIRAQRTACRVVLPSPFPHSGSTDTVPWLPYTHVPFALTGRMPFQPICCPHPRAPQAPVTATVPASATADPHDPRGDPQQGPCGSNSSAPPSAARSAHLLLPLPPTLSLHLPHTPQANALHHTAAHFSSSGCAPCTTPCPAVPTTASTDDAPPSLLPSISHPAPPMCLAAAVPLLCNGYTAAVLWLVGPPTAAPAAPTAASGTMPTPGPGSVPPPSAAAKEQQPTAQPRSTGTPLLGDAAALRHVALAASLCLLGGDPARREQLQRLAAAVHAVDCAGSMQQLVGALCEAVHVQVGVRRGRRWGGAVVGRGWGMARACQAL